ncbi:MAG: pyruvate kinase [Planctomycetota bacterium]
MSAAPTSSLIATKPVVHSKIVATLGPASNTPEMLRKLIEAGVDLFRINFAHAKHDILRRVIADVRSISAELDRHVGLLGDLSGPKIRLHEVPDGEVCCLFGGKFSFVRGDKTDDPTELTCTYEQLIDDLEVDDIVVLADGSVVMKVVETQKPERVVCRVEQAGCVRNRQGVNLPGVKLSTPCLTEKDKVDLKFALEMGLEYLGLSFVRAASDIQELRDLLPPVPPNGVGPQIVAKIEKMEAIEDLDGILELTDGVMVARGDLGVEVDIAEVPILQKHIIEKCAERRIPVITATQMLESMIEADFPTRAEATDVCNAVLDGTDAVMLSGESAVGRHPVKVVKTMRRIARNAEAMLVDTHDGEHLLTDRYRVTDVTEAVSTGAVATAERLDADMILVTTRRGRSALAIAKQRSDIPVVAVTDIPEAARAMALYWGVIPLVRDIRHDDSKALIAAAEEFGKAKGMLETGDRIVLVGTSDEDQVGAHDLMLVHTVK